MTLSPGSPPQRLASVIRLRPEREQEYRALHAAVWPEVLDRLRRSNIHNYSIYLRDGLLFGYMEYRGDRLAEDMAAIGEDEPTQRWWKLTDPCQDPLPTRRPGEWWAPAEEIFHLD